MPPTASRAARADRRGARAGLVRRGGGLGRRAAPRHRRHARPESIAFLGGDKLNLEEQYLMQKLARAVLGTPHVDARTRPAAALAGDALRRAIGGGRPPLTFDALHDAQEVLVLFDDLQGEAPFAQANDRARVPPARPARDRRAQPRA